MSYLAKNLADTIIAIYHLNVNLVSCFKKIKEVGNVLFRRENMMKKMFTLLSVIVISITTNAALTGFSDDFSASDLS